MGEDGLEHVGVILLKERFVLVGMWMGEAVIVVGLAVLPVTSTENPEPCAYSVFFQTKFKLRSRNSYPRRLRLLSVYSLGLQRTGALQGSDGAGRNIEARRVTG